MAGISCVMSLEFCSCLWMIFLGEPSLECGCLVMLHEFGEVGCTGGCSCPVGVGCVGGIGCGGSCCVSGCTLLVFF